MKNLTIALAFLMTFSLPVTAQDFQKGLAAYNASDYATAIKEWTPLAENGGSDAQYNLGYLYENGKGVPQDYAEAVRWYRLAAEQGDASAQNNLGNKYLEGKGVPQDYAEAINWYRLAADAGGCSSSI